jgi:hypothetical protein
MKNSNGFIITPDEFNLPSYRIGPFTTNDLRDNYSLFLNEKIDPSETDSFLRHKFGENFKYTINGKEGIYLALESYDLQDEDVVTILTTSQNYYISSCVTREIEKFCKWNREITSETKVILVNHEFGTVYPEMDQLVSAGLPIIEDCCTAFFSQDANGCVGKYGDFAVYSFPKFFPLQLGGLLVNNKGRVLKPSHIKESSKIYIQKVLSHHIAKREELLKKRIAIFEYGVEVYSKLGFTAFFRYDKLQVPSLMMLKNNAIVQDLPLLKNTFGIMVSSPVSFMGKMLFFFQVIRI